MKLNSSEIRLVLSSAFCSLLLSVGLQWEALIGISVVLGIAMGVFCVLKVVTTILGAIAIGPKFFKGVYQRSSETPPMLSYSVWTLTAINILILITYNSVWAYILVGLMITSVLDSIIVHEVGKHFVEEDTNAHS